jgi:hypothetical protein
MGLKDAFRMWLNLVEVGLGEMRLGLEMVRDSMRKR